MFICYGLDTNRRHCPTFNAHRSRASLPDRFCKTTRLALRPHHLFRPRCHCGKFFWGLTRFLKAFRTQNKHFDTDNLQFQNFLISPFLQTKLSFPASKGRYLLNFAAKSEIKFWRESRKTYFCAYCTPLWCALRHLRRKH